MDKAPEFARLSQFLDFWRREIEAVIHSIRVAHVDAVGHAAVDDVVERHTDFLEYAQQVGAADGTVDALEIRVEDRSSNYQPSVSIVEWE